MLMSYSVKLHSKPQHPKHRLVCCMGQGTVELPCRKGAESYRHWGFPFSTGGGARTRIQNFILGHSLLLPGGLFFPLTSFCSSFHLSLPLHVWQHMSRHEL